MSIETCRCGTFIDTDKDDQAYTVEVFRGSHYEEIELDYALCQNCRDEFASLMIVKEKTDLFVQDIFDHVRSVGRVDFLPKLYAFRRDIEAKINPKEK